MTCANLLLQQTLPFFTKPELVEVFFYSTDLCQLAINIIVTTIHRDARIKRGIQGGPKKTGTAYVFACNRQRHI